ncbi:MAG: extradiol ring-cleavage dioxygenase [Candidatus Binatia bacterium]|nr:extradiol ring-cleavage dioxygenase [Candidatus Binatia bacterium]
MGEILGIGVTHYPPLVHHDENMAALLKYFLRSPYIPEEVKRPEQWPEAMRQEWEPDEGRSAAARHRAALVTWFRKMRQEIDFFAPDFIVIWGDDQYENFKEDVIPAFCVLAYEAITATPPWTEEFAKMFGPNVWGEPPDKLFHLRGHRAGAKYLATQLLEAGFDIAYAYKPLHHPLGHAFLNAVLYLDYDRRGFPYALIPFQINSYGRRVVIQRAGLPNLERPPREEELDPPSPSPQRCFELGAAVARILQRSPWRVVLIASSGWSHAFLTAKHWWLYPDVEADRRLYTALQAGQYEYWRTYPLAAIEESGQQEVLNWCCLVGAMAELGRRPQESTLIESWIFNSNKCFAVFRP